jgi:choline dehydrogenase-like flavoprotein
VARTFDYVIVGAGSAGCVLAHRLSGNPDVSVLLMEAGPEDTNRLIRMPKGCLRLHRDPRVMWHFPVTASDGEWQGSLVAGKVLGGTSSVNSMLYVRGTPEDYDRWASSGAAAWSWREIAPCFKEIEDHDLGETETRGAGGLQPISIARRRDELCEALIEAGVAMGLRRTDDLNEPGQERIGYFPATIDRGRRVSASHAFLASARRRPNLTVVPDTLATRLLFRGSRAVGVACTTGGSERRFASSREVILCAGAIQSPKLLQLSGIGRADHLRALGLTVVADSPGVGANLRDHWGLRMQYRLSGSGGHNRRMTGLGRYLSILQYHAFHTGVLSYAMADVGAFVKVSPDAQSPDVELQISPTSMVPGTTRFERRPGVQIAAWPLRPESRGTVTIRSADPVVSPEIRMNSLSAEHDRELTVGMVGYVRRLVRQPSLGRHVAGETHPGPDCRSPAQIVDFCRRFGSPKSHLVGTCRMGEDPQAVVDEELRVRGVSGVRVVDCSVMPDQVSGHTHGPVMSIAWRAADLILSAAART